MKTYDAIIIGFGKGGKTLAADLAKRGRTVAMIERSDKMYGGTCINIGCIPTKTLVHQAKIAAAHKHNDWEGKKKFYKNAISVKEGVTSALRDKNLHNLSDNPNITVYTGEGAFVSPDEVSVTTKQGAETLRSEHIYINTGAETVIPSIPGVEIPGVYDSTSIMELEELPEKLVIVGGGYIGLEFASIYSSFGSEVTVLEGFSELIPREDRDVATCVKETMEKKGVAFRMNAKVSSISKTGKGVTISYQDSSEGKEHKIEADAVLIATGRKPYTEGLDLDKAQVRTDQRGAIIVDEHLQTTNPYVWAIGDVKGGLQFTYISLDDYRIIREKLFGTGDRKTTDRDPVSYSVFIDPPLSRVGMSETEALENGLDIRVNKITVASIPRTRTTGETDGMLKAVIDAKTDSILGCVLFCTDSYEVINTVSLAIKTGIKAHMLRDFIFTHPSMSEALNDLFV